MIKCTPIVNHIKALLCNSSQSFVQLLNNKAGLNYTFLFDLVSQ